MTVKELTDKLGFKPLSLPEPNREIKGAYVGDLLSWVMGRAKPDDAWISIMTNVNVIAVASLSDVSCVILSEGVVPDGEITRTAREKSVNVLSSPLPSYETALLIGGMLK